MTWQMGTGGGRDELAVQGLPRSTLRLCSRLGGSSKGGCSICDRVSGPTPGFSIGVGNDGGLGGMGSGLRGEGR